MTQRVSKTLLLLVVFVCGWFTISALADSQVRIVRLSDLDGDVQIDHGTGYEKALRNMPITQGVKLWTKAGGLAEVEFEDGSTVRLTPDTIVAFPQLLLRDSGVKVSTVEVNQGTAYFNLGKQKKDEFTVQFGDRHVAIRDAVSFRIDRNDTQAKIAVTKGELTIQGPSHDVKVAKNHTLSIDVGENGTYEIAKGVEPGQYDNWNREEGQFQNQYNYGNAATNSWPYSYGLADLNYYGNYFYQPGWGWLWQPYYVGAGWDPFMNGAWSWYPGVGYTFVSMYPWGWMPYRYGSWAFVPGWGWCWQPGGFYGWNAAPVIVDPPVGFRAPAPPPVNTAANHPTVPSRPVSRNPHSPMVIGGAPLGRVGIEGGRPGRVMTQVPIHGGGMRPGYAQSMGNRSPSMIKGTMGPHGTMLGPRGSIARSPAMTAPRMGGEPRMGGFGGVRSMGTAPAPSAPHISAPPPPPPSSPHH
ncbi:MAG TPA: FecR family protein [Terriglobales bacterium]|nr:FecR family protein [Terriglobales bacterium]